MISALITGQSERGAEMLELVQAADSALARPLGDVVEATIRAAAAESPHTARAYRHACGLFLAFLGDQRQDDLPADWLPLAEATTGDRGQTVWMFRGQAGALRLVDASLVDGWRYSRAAAGDKPNTIMARYGAVRTFLAVALRDGILTPRQASALALKPYQTRVRRDLQPVGRRLTREEVRALRAAVDTRTAKGKRDLAILDVMLFAWLRREEVAGLQMSQVRQDGGRWWLVFAGKGNKTRRVKVADALFRTLTAWLEVAGRALGADVDAPVFSAVGKGERITERAVDADTVSRLVAEYGHKARLAPATGDQRLTPHDLRRTGARNAHDNGAPLPLIQAQLGHASPTTTMRYIGAVGDDGDTGADYVRY